MLKIELRRAMRSKGFLLALLIGIGIVLLQFICDVLPLSQGIDEYIKLNKGLIFPGWLYTTWIGGEPSSIYSFIYFLILPVLAAWPHGDSLFCDNKSGFINNICTRIDKKRYFISKYFSTFISAGIVAISPLLINFYLSSMVLPAMRPEIASFDSLINELSSFPNLFYNHPLIYVMLFIIIIFVFSGLMGTLSLIISFVVDYRFLVITFPFLINIFMMMIFDLVGLEAWESIHFLNPSYGLYTINAIVIEIGILFLATFFIFNGLKSKEDILS